MENPEEILHSLEEFSKLKPKDIPRELEDYLCFVAKTGDPVYQWSAVKSLFREKLINVITEFYESCPTIEIPPCPNVEMFNYDSMKNFILEKLDTFAAAPFTVQRICELLTTPRKEYNRIDKYMRALEKNILVVSTTEPANRRNTENGEGIVNGIETEHLTEANSSNDINVEEMDDSPSWPRISQQEPSLYEHSENGTASEAQPTLNQTSQDSQENISSSEPRITIEPSTSNTDSVITCTPTEKPFVSIEPVVAEPQLEISQEDTSVTITAIPAPVQKRRDSIEPLTSDDNAVSETVNNNPAEDPIKEEPAEEKITPSDAESKAASENSQSSAESDNSSNDGDVDGTVIDEKSIETEKEMDVPTEIKEIEKEEVKISLQEEEEEPEPNPVPQEEPEAQQTCDNTREVENTESCVGAPNEQLEESTPEQTLKESEPHLASAESTPKSEENLTPSGDSNDESTKEPSQKESNPATISATTDEVESTIEKQSEETPMEVDSDENLVKESTAEVSSIETNTAK